VVRFKNPTDGVVVWNDLVKGRIEIANSELDDLIIARSDGTPTYNFCVVVDDWDMQITHVTRGDDHVNNTPRQINILQALGAPVPQYAHLPMILRDDGQKMSKRRDPVSVMQYQEMGILPEALLNYLSRLCWGHGDDEVFSIAQFVEWFNLDNISPSPARFDMKKLFWVNSQHIKNMDNVKLLEVIEPGLIKLGIDVKELDITSILDLVKTRGDNLNTITQEVAYFYQPQTASQDDVTKHLTDLAISLLNAFANALDGLDEWSLEAIKAMVKEFCAVQNIKMPQLGMPLRLKLCGTTQTPSFDAVLYILGKNNVLSRLSKSIS
jgi:glutamyl-tRNA synthetase